MFVDVAKCTYRSQNHRAEDLVVQHFPTMHEALNSIPSTTKSKSKGQTTDKTVVPRELLSPSEVIIVCNSPSLLDTVHEAVFSVHMWPLF